MNVPQIAYTVEILGIQTRGWRRLSLLMRDGELCKFSLLPTRTTVGSTLKLYLKLVLFKKVVRRSTIPLVVQEAIFTTVVLVRSYADPVNFLNYASTAVLLDVGT